MRIGTWNLDSNWSLAHHVFRQNQMCDVWLLTEARQHLGPGLHAASVAGEHALRKALGWRLLAALTPTGPA